MTKPRLAFDEHDQLGHRLAAIRSELIILEVHPLNAYPKTGPEAVPARKLAEARQASVRRFGTLRTAFTTPPARIDGRVSLGRQ
ncbi:hypothetical protein ACIPRU_32130 [Streptomyces sp. NPDC090126]|uniref:hypothetical protein n=1 Tax=Streptomyces sp. NPDC090126 TaxID=3365952 RepID=UPI003804ADF6